MDDVRTTPPGPAATVEGRVASADGTPIAYRRCGGGPPLVLVGGALSPGGWELRLAGLLAGRFTTYTYDRRGRGGSGGGAGGYAPEREVEDLAAVVAAAGAGAGVHGTSSGGALALEAAAAGVPMGRLSVYEPPYGADGDVHDGVPAGLLAGIHARVLVLDGGASPRWLRDAARAVAGALPQGRHTTLTGQTHTAAPQVLAPVLAGFFAR
ncbi:alpha/beta fold hydrolase [Streptomyces sp. DH12]|uniref:alpha/beta fold hydrolase n=1 Tax=Streptomyces sp. DH12 TaxID=2857010 RepID=UPI001E3DBC82|nr:alpha/beta fold hydrolase [Streptomyces sp. DH12]